MKEVNLKSSQSAYAKTNWCLLAIILECQIKLINAGKERWHPVRSSVYYLKWKCTTAINRRLSYTQTTSLPGWTQEFYKGTDSLVLRGRSL